MSKSKHTPGPWSAEEPDEDHPSEARVTACNGFVAIYEAPLTDETDANARLIAAAPALLEALEDAAELVKIARRYFPQSMHNSDRFTLENTNAAIGKALSLARGEG